MTDEPDDFAEINERLWSMLPADQVQRVFAHDRADIDREFLGFVSIYYHLSRIIPAHFAILDLGCAYAPQAFFFERHAQYVGVDICGGPRFRAANTTHYELSIREFIDRHWMMFDSDETFVICSYVPSWGGNNAERARSAFKNVFTFYPSNKREAKAISRRMQEAKELHHD